MPMAEALDQAGANHSLANPVSIWTNLRNLYPLYCELAREFSLEIPACDELKNHDATDERLARAEAWMAEIDGRIGVHQLRQYLQTSPTATGDALRELLVHYWAKGRLSDAARDKLDFVAVQYLFERAPRLAQGADLSFDQVAEFLAPVTGPVKGDMPEWLARLEALVTKAQAARDLNELFTARIIEQAREIKTGAGEQFFSSVGLVGLARFGLRLRRIFFRLMHEDLNRILEALSTLESQGVASLDCRKAQFSAEEPVARLRMICQSWKVMFQAEYSFGQPLCILVDLRTAIEAALLERARRDEAGDKAKAAARGSR